MKATIAVILAGALVALGAPRALSQTSQPGSRGVPREINVTADSLSVGEAGTQIEAQGNVEIKREQTTLRADEVRVNRVTQDVEAKGKISVDDPEWKIKSADAVQLNLEKETGEIRNGDLFIEQGHISISGRRFQKLPGQTYHIDEAFFTTCLCESGRSPWKVSAESMDLEPSGLGSVKNAYFYVLDVPVLYLPYAFFPVRTERQSGFLFPKIGQSSKDGFRFQQPFFWAISKSSDATLTFNFESRARIGALGEFRTLFSRDDDFQIHGSYFNEGLRKFENQSIVDRSIADPDIPPNRWSVIGSHRYNLPANWLTYSDFAAYRDDLFTRELIDRFDLTAVRESDIQRSRYSRSRFGVFRSWGDVHLQTEWDFYQDFIQSDDITLHRTPQLALWGRHFFGDFPLELRWRATGVNYLRRDGGDGLRMDLRPEVVLPFRLGSALFGSWSVAPRETAYHLYSPVQSDRNFSRELIEIRGNIETSLTRVFARPGSTLSAIKHVIEPGLRYLFVPRTDQSKIPIMDDVDRVNRRNVVTFALANRLWGKFIRPLAVGESEKEVELLNPVGTGNVRELGSLNLALSYDIDKERKGGDSLSDLDMNLRLSPLDYISFRFDGGLDPGRWHVTQARLGFGIVDPRPLGRRSLDADFNRPNSLAFEYHFLRRGPNGFLAEDANIDLSVPATPAYCGLHPRDPRCLGFNKNIVGNFGGNLLYHVGDNFLVFLNSSYNVRDGRFLGVRAATKFLSTCECWTVTLGIKHDINPSRTSFSFDFSLLGLGPQKSITR